MRTSQKKSFQINSHPLIIAGLVTGLLALSACQPIRDPAVITAEQTAVASGDSAPEATETTDSAETPESAEGTETPEATTVSGVEAPTVTISADSLRVRTEPNEDSEQVASVEEGETFAVTGISSDGEWIQIEIEDGPDGLGWVSAEFVTLAGDITDIEVIDVSGEEVATAEATEEATEEAAATEEATEEATAEATEEPTEEATEGATEEATEEATPEPTAEATEEAAEEATSTEEASEEATVEATAVVTEEATIEATAEITAEATSETTPTPEATTAVTETATPEATGAVTETATPEATSEGATPELGTVTIVADPPLRVRSAPTAEEENKIGNVFDGEVYTVLEVSEDGLWIKIETPQFPEGSGWVSAEYVVYNEAE